MNYGTSYDNDYQKINNPVKANPCVVKKDFETTLNEIFPK